MLNTIYISSSKVYSSFHEKLELALTPQQKRIMTIAALAFAVLAVCYAAISRYKPMQQNEVKAKQIEDEIKKNKKFSRFIHTGSRFNVL